MCSALNDNRTREANVAVAAGIAVVIAGALDMLGEPPAAWHPVVWFGELIRFLEQAAPFRGKNPYTGWAQGPHAGSAQGPLHPATLPPIPTPFPHLPVTEDAAGSLVEDTQTGSAQDPLHPATLPPIPTRFPHLPVTEDAAGSLMGWWPIRRDRGGGWVGRGPCADPVWGIFKRDWKAGGQFLYGIATLILATPIAILPTLAIHTLAQRIQKALTQRGYPRLGILSSALLQGVSLKPFFALRMLAEAGGTVRQALEQGDLLAARYALRSLVSRDCSQLTAELVAAAAIESLAENLSDSVVAPLFYYVLLGVPGAAAYRLFNTFDSMLGYHGRYEYLGKVAARLDDVLNFVPARLTALLIIALAPVFGGNRRAAWLIWRRDARKTESPNAGHPMAAAAGALEVQLEKVDHYILGDANDLGTGQAQGTVPTACIRKMGRRDSALRLSASWLPLPCSRPQATHLQLAEQMVWRIGVGVIALTAVLSWLRRSGKWSR
jgi:adenosylcobinamide-phosphate synthase